jgi:hypothetical protein
MAMAICYPLRRSGHVPVPTTQFLEMQCTAMPPPRLVLTSHGTGHAPGEHAHNLGCLAPIAAQPSLHPNGFEVGARRVGQVHRVAAVGIHDVNLHVAIAVSLEEDPGPVG